MSSFGAQESKTFGQMESRGRAQSPAVPPVGSPADETHTEEVQTVQMAPEPPQGAVEDGIERIKAMFGPAAERHSQGEPMRWAVGYFMLPDPHSNQMHLVVALYCEIPSPVLSPDGKKQVLTQTGEWGVLSEWTEEKVDVVARDVWEALRTKRSEMLGTTQGVGRSGLVVP